MADDDEIDILGDFSFNSCLAQNNQGIPSCSNREDTVHPQWFLDSTANNWYDIQSKSSIREMEHTSRRLSGSSPESTEVATTWNQSERKLLVKEMAKYGRNVRKISETIKTKTEAEIQALIDAEYGVMLDTPSFGLDKHEEHEDVPSVVQEEIVTDDTVHLTGELKVVKNKRNKNSWTTKSKHSLLKPIVKTDIIDSSEIFYEEDFTVCSTESISTNVIPKNQMKYQKAKIGKIIGNHRRKVSRNYDKCKPKNRNKDLLKSPPERQRKDSSLSEDSTKSPKMHILLGSGQALPVSEGEQVIKIEKKKESDSESDIDIDVDSDREDVTKTTTKTEQSPKLVIDEAPIAVPLRKFEPMPRRQKKINLDGGGGYTIMHTSGGDLYEIAAEPRRERAPRKPPIHLIQCRYYNADKPAPFTVRLHVSALISMDWHAHCSRAEVMGLLGGGGALAGDKGAAGTSPGAGGADLVLVVAAYRPAAAAAAHTHCDMDPVSQAAAAEYLSSQGLSVAGWHHSHPRFPAWPSARDLLSALSLQQALEPLPSVALITSQHWPVGRQASQYRCISVEPGQPSGEPVGYQVSVRLEPDLTELNVDALVEQLAHFGADARDPHRIHLATDVCRDAKITYLDKCLSSIQHHLRSAGYSHDAPVARRLLRGLRHAVR